MSQLIASTRSMKSWDETTTKEIASGLKINSAVVNYEYSGDIVGSSTVQYTMMYLSPSLVKFSGYELIELTSGDDNSSFVLFHEGTFDNGVAILDVKLVEGSAVGPMGKNIDKVRIENDASDPMKSYMSIETLS